MICADSPSVLSSLSFVSSDHPVLTDIIDTYNRLRSIRYDIMMICIPSHRGIPGNDVADRKATEAIFLNITRETGMGYKEYYPSLRSAIRDTFAKMWADCNPHTALKSVKENVGMWDSAKRKNRREEIVLCRLRLGHTRLTHSFLIDRNPRPECAHCQCFLSVRHVMLECPVYANQRRIIVEKCRYYSIPFSLKSVIGNDYLDIIDEVFVYLRACNLMKKL